MIAKCFYLSAVNGWTLQAITRAFCDVSSFQILDLTASGVERNIYLVTTPYTARSFLFQKQCLVLELILISIDTCTGNSKSKVKAVIKLEFDN